MRSLAAHVSNLRHRFRAELLLDGQVPKLGVGGGLLARCPRLKRNVGIDGNGSCDGRGIGADHTRQGTIPLCTRGERRSSEQIRSRLTVAGTTMSDKSRARTAAWMDPALCPGFHSPRIAPSAEYRMNSFH